MQGRSLILGFAAVLGIGGVANGLFMLVDPANWYLAVPGVTTTGPFNQHFIRDIGLIFALIGAAMLGGAMLAAQRVKLWSASASWLTGHALFHLWEVSVGICGSDAIARDFPAVTLPAILSTALACWAWRDARRSKAQNAFS
ncbi:hypothetical protein ACYZX9_14620 [Sphingomonas citri]